LNQQGTRPIANNIRKEKLTDFWSRSYVAKILADKAVTGEYQPHVMKDGKRVPHGDPRPDYFPEVIPQKQRYAVRQAVKERGKKLGPKGVGVASLFTSLIRDARDGETMHLCYSGSSRKNNTRVLVSSGCRNGKPGSVYLPFAHDFLRRLF
jgi:hypothetical protein